MYLIELTTEITGKTLIYGQETLAFYVGSVEPPEQTKTSGSILLLGA